MAYKRIRVWDGSVWQEIGAQVPSVVDASGSQSTSLITGARTLGVSFGFEFSFTPLVFVQVTGTNHATVTVQVDTTGFTANLKGTGSESITFSWFAIQADFS
jgi:hypothetical protein